MRRSTAKTCLIVLALAGAVAACDTMGGGDNSAATGSSGNTSATAPSGGANSSGSMSGATGSSSDTTTGH